MDCDSEGVEREFRTAPGIRSDATKLTDAGFRRTSDVYGLSDMNNKDGQAVKQGDPTAAIWGKEQLSGNFDSMMAQAQTPISVQTKEGIKTDYNRGIQVAQESTNAFGGHVVQPAGEYMVNKSDKRGKARLRIRE